MLFLTNPANPGKFQRRVSLFALFALFWLMGCASIPYHYTRNVEDRFVLKLEPAELQIERGRPVWLVDALGHYILSLPSKILLLNWRVDNHKVSSETEKKLQAYLLDNDLENVKVRLNQYAPGAEWRRLIRNPWMQGGWRYTLGVLTMVYYTILPGRLFGGDNYNPYTNTINIYSDHKAIVLHEAGHARDFTKQTRGFRGVYAFLRIFPLVPLYHEKQATSDAIGYDWDKLLYDDLKADYKILYPAYCTYIAGEGLRWVQTSYWIQYAVMFAAVIPGHIVGRIKAATIEPSESPAPNHTDKPMDQSS